MESNYHVLNGDSLKQQFPEDIEGEVIISRECLIEGVVKSADLDSFFQQRARFITEFYGNNFQGNYFEYTVQEFKKIIAIPEEATVNLWFEDDLFCQVNFWFVAHLLSTYVENCNVFLVRPHTHNHYGFGGLSKPELMEAYQKKVQIMEIDRIASLWQSYQSGDMKSLIDKAKVLKKDFPFIMPAVQAHIERLPSNGKLGKPKQSLIAIMEELDTKEFIPIFREFSKRESIYGFGDLQVKRLFDEIINDRK